VSFTIDQSKLVGQIGQNKAHVKNEIDLTTKGKEHSPWKGASVHLNSKGSWAWGNEVAGRRGNKPRWWVNESCKKRDRNGGNKEGEKMNGRKKGNGVKTTTLLGLRWLVANTNLKRAYQTPTKKTKCPDAKASGGWRKIMETGESPGAGIAHRRIKSKNWKRKKNQKKPTLAEKKERDLSKEDFKAKIKRRGT